MRLFSLAMVSLSGILISLTIVQPAYGSDIGYDFVVPRASLPPEIVSTNHSTPSSGSLDVFVDIRGMEQKEVCCDPSGSGGSGPEAICEHECEPTCDFSSCELTDFYSIADTRFNPNPTCIPSDVDQDGLERTVCSDKANPVVNYYFSGDISTAQQKTMTYDSSYGRFSANIEIPPESVEGSTIKWHFSAADSAGNVVTEIPNYAGGSPCNNIDTWNSDNETPVVDNCAMMSSHQGNNGVDCGIIVPGPPPDGCYEVTGSPAYTVNDPLNDTCSASGTIEIASTVDITGFSAGFESGMPDALCTKIGFNAQPPDLGTSSGAIDSYIVVITNPDIIDTQPYDVQMTNSVSVVYAPEIAASDSLLTTVLWDNNCISNPDTADPLSCPHVYGGTGEERIKVAKQGNELYFRIQDDLPEDFAISSIFGATSESTHISVSAGYMDFSGDIIFWTADSAPALALYTKSNSTFFFSDSSPGAPIPETPIQCAWPDGTTFSSGTCEKSAEEPFSSNCNVTLYPSPDCSKASSYNIYKSSFDNASSASLMKTYESSLCSIKTFTLAITKLDGLPRYLFFSAVSEDGQKETSTISWTKANCTPEDWTAPDEPQWFYCNSTPGKEFECSCEWSKYSDSDSTLAGYRIWRGTSADSIDTLLTPNPIPAGASYFTYVDYPAPLEPGQGYIYAAEAMDFSNNFSVMATNQCVPEDRKDPGKIDSLTITLQSATPTVNLMWNATSDSDVEGYNAYFCETTGDTGSNCLYHVDFSKINSSLITSGTALFAEDISVEFNPDATQCFWIEACDNCVTEGTCPSNNGYSNCSDFDALEPYRKCVTVMAEDSDAPFFPTNLSATSIDTGEKCRLEWDRVCEDDGGPFGDCSAPDATQLSGYWIMGAQTPPGAETCNSVTIPTPSSFNLADRPIAHATDNPFFIASALPDGSTLTNEASYCFRVYAFDIFENFSTNTTIQDPVFCSPQDTVAPSAPIMNDMSFSDVSCSPSWSQVADADPVTYSLYRCDDSPASCSGDDFNLLLDATNITNLAFDDTIPETTMPYTYCVTASDTSMNSSPVISEGSNSAADSANCKLCWMVDVNPPSTVKAAANMPTPNYGINVWWTDSLDDSGSGSYDVFICKSLTDSSSCTQIGNNVDGGRTASAPFTRIDCGVPFSSTYYAAVVYSNDEGEQSPLAFSDNPLTIDPLTDTVPPSMPQILSTASASGSCALSWSEPYDPALLSYTVNKCDNTPANCTESNFEPASSAVDIIAASHTDTEVTVDSNYTYCITAEDPHGNESSFFEDDQSTAQWSSNCGWCFTGDSLAPPSNLHVEPYKLEDNNGVTTWWDDSLDDDGFGFYDVYVCTNSTGSIESCTQIGDGVIGNRSSERLFIVENCNVPEPGNYFLAIVFFNGSSVKSDPAFSETSIQIESVVVDPCDTYDCTTKIHAKGAFKRVSISGVPGNYTIINTPIQDSEILVLSDETNIETAIASQKATNTGEVDAFFVQDRLIESGTTYYIVAKLPAGSFDAPYTTNCRNDVDSDSFCIVRLETPVLPSSNTIIVNAKLVPTLDSDGLNGYGSEIGNPNGDESINLFDIASIKYSINTLRGDPCYREWADLNQDGLINLFDLAVIKDHLNEHFNLPDGYVPTLNESNNPITSECF